MKNYVCGDIHGCYYTLLSMINKLPLESNDKLIFLGDYIDRGPYSKEVVQYVKTLTESNQAIALMGNHERMCTDPYDQRTWLYNGGDVALDSYDTRTDAEKVIPSFDDIEARELWQTKLPKISSDHYEWMENLPLFYEDDDYFYVHAGINPNGDLYNQHESDLLWIRNVFLNSNKDFAKKIIFGHTPFKEILKQKNKIGLDTGCVFGGTLSMYCPQTGEFYSEPLHIKDQNKYSR